MSCDYYVDVASMDMCCYGRSTAIARDIAEVYNSPKPEMSMEVGRWERETDRDSFGLG